MTVVEFINKFFFLLFPGCICHIIFSYLCKFKPFEEAYSLLYILIDSILSFLIGNVFLGIINLFSGGNSNFDLVNIVYILSGNDAHITNSNLLSAIIASLILAFVFFAAIEKSWLFGVARKMRLTNRIDNQKVWEHLFDTTDFTWIVLRDYVTKNIFYGRVDKCFEEGGVYEFLLADVSVFSRQDGKYKMKSIYLARNISEFSIEVDDYSAQKEYK